MLDTLRFWLDRGVDGFRVDVAHYLAKDPEFKSNPPSTSTPDGVKDYHEYASQEHLYDNAHPEIHAIHRRIRSVLDEYEDRFSVGEIHEFDWERWARYFGDDLDQLHMPYNFSLLWADWNAGAFRDRIIAQEAALPEGAWPNHVFGNHDEPRLATRYGVERTRTAALLLLTLRGTPTMYYGDEFGLIDVVIPLGEEQDPWGQKYPDLNRDMCRSPMQWALGDGMGFTAEGVKPWLPFADPDNSVESQLKDPSSILRFYQTLLELRREIAELARGDIEMLDSNAENVLTYRRSLDGQTSFIAVNFTAESQLVEFPTEVQQILSTSTDRSEPFTSILLGPNEAVIAR